MSKYNTTSYYTVYKDGTLEQRFPCHCGETHRGDYAAETYAQHNCLHMERMAELEASDPPSAMCVQCGAVFEIERKGNQ